MVKNKTIFLFVSIFLVAIAIVMYAVILVRRDLFRDFFSYGAYYLVLLLFLFWVKALFQYTLQYIRNFWETLYAHKNGILICLMITSIVFISVQSTFRVLSDETNLVAVSKSMVYEKRTDNVTMGKWYYDNFYPMNREIDKRPLLFPFLASLVHTVLGYRAENVFILNFIVLFTLLVLVYAFIKTNLSEIWAFVSVVLVASQPVVTQCATSGGFDLLAGLFLFISFVNLWSFLKEPSAIRLQLLWFSLLMFANVRYEGIPALVITMLYLGLFGYLKTEYFKSDHLVGYAITPLLLLPLIMQKIFVDISLQIPLNATTFSFENFINNNTTFLKSLVDFRFYLPYATIINLIGLLGLLYGVYAYIAYHRRIDENKKHFYSVCGIIVVFYWIFYTSYYYGKIDHPTSSRYYVFFFYFLSISAALVLYRFNLLKQKPVLAAAFSVLMFILYQPVSIEDRFSRTQTLPREYRFTMEFLKKAVENSKQFLIVADRPGQYAIHNYGAVGFSYANANYNLLIEGVNNHLYENIYVIQDILYGSNQSTKETELNRKYELEKILESQNNAQFFTRISKIKVPKVKQGI